MLDLSSQQNVCRICFDKEIRLTDIFSTMKMDLIPLNEMLKFCTNVEVRIFVDFFHPCLQLDLLLTGLAKFSAIVVDSLLMEIYYRGSRPSSDFDFSLPYFH